MNEKKEVAFDRFYLMVQVAPDTWKKIHRGTYDSCMDVTFKLSDEDSWLIVKPAREHFGRETWTSTLG